ncbi:MAG: outer membrane beta-barrel protein [Desulfobacteraceae bacterium]|nr:outer membrane beta-barrel protein [Desulfobacteraceae bacterium]
MLLNQDETIEDETTHNPSVIFNYWAIPSRLGFKAAAAYTHSDFSETTTKTAYSEESITPSVGISYWFIPRNFGIDAGVSYRKGSFSEPYAKDIPEPIIAPESDEESINPTFGINYRYLPYKLDMNMSLSYMDATFSDPTQNFENWYGTIRVSKKVSSNLSTFIQYTHTIAQFAEGGRENYSIYDPSVGITYLLGHEIPLTLGVGYFIRDMEISENEAGLSFKGDIGKAWTFGKTTLNLSANSGYDQSYFGANAMGFGVFYDMKAAVRHSFSRDTSGDMFAAYRKDRYLDEKSVRNDENREAGAGMTWFLLDKWLSVRLGYNFRELLSTLPENSYTENRVSLIFTASHPRLLRIKD